MITGIRRSGKSYGNETVTSGAEHTRNWLHRLKTEWKIYIQVAYKLESEQTVRREFSPLQAIADNHPKYVITTDDFWQENIDGIVHRHIGAFLLEVSG